MTGEHALADLTGCPRCDKAPLETKGDAYYCAACKVEFPSLAGIPVLFSEPQASLAEWRGRLHFALQKYAGVARSVGTALKKASLSDLTRQRLEAEKAAIDDHRDKLRELLAPLDVGTSSTTLETYLALRTRLPADQGISTYYANIHRDWAWGDEENEASVALVQQAAGEAAFGDTLVLGAGAGRLACDLHQRSGAPRTVAVDFNPLLSLVAQRMIAGQSLELYEFPLAPVGIDDFAVLRNLSAPAPVRDGLKLVLADALRPPFRAQAFDTVVTPWLVDIVDDEFGRQARRINRLLKDGGRWINFGSLAFEHADRSRCYSAEEVVDILASNAFADVATINETIPYMCSPASRHGRRETVFVFSATKSGEAESQPRHVALPDWIVTGKKPVPQTAAFRSQAMSTRIHAYIMSLIDGRRTLDDMAVLLEQQQLMSREEARSALRNFLARMHDDSAKP